MNHFAHLLLGIVSLFTIFQSFSVQAEISFGPIRTICGKHSTAILECPGQPRCDSCDYLQIPDCAKTPRCLLKIFTCWCHVGYRWSHLVRKCIPVNFCGRDTQYDEDAVEQPTDSSDNQVTKIPSDINNSGVSGPYQIYYDNQSQSPNDYDNVVDRKNHNLNYDDLQKLRAINDVMDDSFEIDEKHIIHHTHKKHNDNVRLVDINKLRANNAPQYVTNDDNAASLVLGK